MLSWVYNVHTHSSWMSMEELVRWYIVHGTVSKVVHSLWISMEELVRWYIVHGLVWNS